MTSRHSRIFILDDEHDMAENLGRIVAGAGHEPIVCCDGERAMTLIERERPDLVITDLRMPGMDGMELLERLQTDQPSVPVIMITGYATIDAAVEAMRKGATDFLAKPFPPEELTLKIAKALNFCRLLDENRYLREAVQLRNVSSRLIGESAPIQEIRAILSKISGSDSRVLITGESGTGKEVAARVIHEESPRRGAGFFAINCVALTESLLESELFGHEKGSFTGAASLKRGVFEMAHGGTLFLDEIGDTSQAFQAKLLRVIQESEFKRVGGDRAIKTDVRVIASTNKELHKEIAALRFREDLFYRLSVIRVHLPPLRERISDIPLLVEHFLRRHALKLAKKAPKLSEAGMQVLAGYNWPGNVRELENVLERAMLMASGGVIDQRDLAGLYPDPEIRRRGGTLEDLERELIERTLAECDGNKTLAARRLGIGRRTLYEKAGRYGIRLRRDDEKAIP